jgi:hypothetical protein
VHELEELNNYNIKMHGKTIKFLEDIFQAVMRSFLTRVHLCIEEGGGHLKDIFHKNCNYIKKLNTIVNCDVVKLVSITFSKKVVQIYDQFTISAAF